MTGINHLPASRELDATIDDDEQGLLGKVGVVVRLGYGDCGSWIRFPERYENVAWPWEADDAGGRAADIILYPEECEAVG